MKISVNWLKDFVDLDGVNIKDLWYRFTMSTAEIEDFVEVGKDIQKVIVAKVLKVEPHPSSQKLKVVDVDTGAGTVRCLCGAPNIRENILVPFAKVGGSIKKIAAVTQRTIEGVESNGVICSAAELGISDSHEGVLILSGDYKPGTDIKAVMDIEDIIIDIDNKSLTNRPDLWGHYGIAREISAILKRKLKPLDLAELKNDPALPRVDLEILDQIKCPRYSCLGIGNIKAKEAPLNMQIRLYYCGMRSISLMVDLTNYLMLELGQPMHAFDQKQIQKIVVRATAASTQFTTLDNVERTLPKDVLLICNQDKPVAIAGIMGGANSEVSDDTTAIVLESANFEGASIRKSAVKIGLRTEASARFEKMLDPNLTVTAIRRFFRLLQFIQPDVKLNSNLTDCYPKPAAPVTLTIDKPYIDMYIGNILEPDLIADTLRWLEFGVERQGDQFTLQVPSFRATKDITRKVDIIEEITRIYGYDNIVPQTVNVALKPLNYNEERILEHKFKEILAEKFGFSEVNSYVWFDSIFNKNAGINAQGTLKLVNPNAAENDTLRNTMAPTLLALAAHNVKFYDDFSLFELGGIFRADDPKSKCREDKVLCALTASKTRNADSLFYELKGVASYLLKLTKNIELEYRAAGPVLEHSWVHPVKSTEIYYHGKLLGYLSVINPLVNQNIDKKLNMALMELDMSLIQTIAVQPIRYNEPSKYPEVVLDFNFLADRSEPFHNIESYIRSFQNSLFTGVGFIDYYQGKGIPENQKSITFRINIGSKEKTLTNEDISQFTQEFLSFMKEKGYGLRG
jgi:phenylalanyl-tRNA synthetase beta chain